MKFTLGFSPCPNDTFIFDALVNNKIDTEGLSFETHLEDVQTLNEWALEGRLDITKISYGVLPLVLDNYRLLNSGGALGEGVGPLLISNGSLGIVPGDPGNTVVNEAIIAIPGENTTAHFLFSQAYPDASHKVFMRFDEIENFVLNPPSSFLESGANVMGVIIHENRFTYQDKGLHKIADLGDYWEKTTSNPIPLGGIIMRNDPVIAEKIERLIKKSLQYAWEHYPEISDYVKSHSQEMSEDVMRQHIELYVNDYTTELGKKGKSAVEKLMEVYSRVYQANQMLDTDIFL